MRRRVLALGAASAALAGLTAACAGSGGTKIHGVDTADAKAVAGAFVLDWLRCSDEAIERQYDLIARPPTNRNRYVNEVRASCRPRGPAQLQQSVLSSDGTSRVVEVRFRYPSGSGTARVHVTDAGHGYRVDRPMALHARTFEPA